MLELRGMEKGMGIKSNLKKKNYENPPSKTS
jgi:hypothetical protein